MHYLHLATNEFNSQQKSAAPLVGSRTRAKGPNEPELNLVSIL